MAEYEAWIAGLEAAWGMNVKDLEDGDSIPIISQAIGEWWVKSPKLAKHKGYLIEIPDAFRTVSFNYLPCFKNQFADDLVTLSSMLKISDEHDLRLIMVQTYDRPVHCHNIESDPDGNPWYHEIKAFLKHGSYLESADIR